MSEKAGTSPDATMIIIIEASLPVGDLITTLGFEHIDCRQVENLL